MPSCTTANQVFHLFLREALKQQNSPVSSSHIYSFCCSSIGIVVIESLRQNLYLFPPHFAPPAPISSSIKTSPHRILHIHLRITAWTHTHTIDTIALDSCCHHSYNLFRRQPVCFLSLSHRLPVLPKQPIITRPRRNTEFPRNALRRRNINTLLLALFFSLARSHLQLCSASDSNGLRPAPFTLIPFLSHETPFVTHCS